MSTKEVEFIGIVSLAFVIVYLTMVELAVALNNTLRDMQSIVGEAGAI